MKGILNIEKSLCLAALVLATVIGAWFAQDWPTQDDRPAVTVRVAEDLKRASWDVEGLLAKAPVEKYLNVGGRDPFIPYFKPVR